jgi:ACS family hexuronate transporter-like MFS transporter
VHRARLVTFLAAGLFTAASMAAAGAPRGPLLLALLLCVAFGSLGLFATYYSLTQELSLRHQGKVTGSLSCITWLCTSAMHQVIGWQIEASQGNYPRIMLLAGLAPLAAFGILALLWNWPPAGSQTKPR